MDAKAMLAILQQIHREENKLRWLILEEMKRREALAEIDGLIEDTKREREEGGR